MTLRKSAHFRVEQYFSPYPAHYRQAFAFSVFLYPQHPQRSLRSTCRFRRHYGLTLFRLNFRAGRPPPIRRRPAVHDDPGIKGFIPGRVPFWFKPVSTFGLLSMTTFNRGSHMLVVAARS